MARRNCHLATIQSVRLSFSLLLSFWSSWQSNEEKKKQTWAEPAGPRLFCRLLGESVRSRRSVRLAEFFVLSSSFPAIRGHSNQLEVPSMVKSRERERVHPLTMIRLNSGLGRRGDMLNSSVSQLGLKHGELCENFFFFFCVLLGRVHPRNWVSQTDLGSFQ